MAFGSFKRWLYRGNRPNWIAQLLNRFWAAVHSSRIAPEEWVTLEVIGRKSGRLIALPVAVAVVDGQRYLVSMLGNDAQWVQNVRSAQGKAFIRHGSRTAVQLVEIPAAQRPPILKAYLKCAPGARPHIPVDKDAPLSAFAAVAGAFPVFRIDPPG
ncbi:MAG: nitroreductase family deazaflavin-dependent oxidoreductase [Anaerolineae bacterium]|nr:nitroreductase family deazaflavin-dependent oxidoreductase [Anaerolineae bacterium]